MSIYNRSIVPFAAADQLLVMASPFRSDGLTVQESLMGDVVQAQAITAAADEVSVWPGELDEQLISELLSDDSLLGAGLVPAADVDDSKYYSCHTEGASAAAPCNSCGSTVAEQLPAAAAVRRSLCSVYTGPTIRDIEKALASRPAPYHSSRRYRSSLYLFGASSSTAAESKFTTKVRSCGGKMPADGYKWRKYGQKSIKNNPHPRSYYKCTSSRCGAKRHVEKSTNDPEMLIVTYEGTHLHGPQPLLRHLHPPASTADHFSRAAVVDVYKTMARPSRTSDDGTGAAGVGSCTHPSRETRDGEVRAGGKLEHGRRKRSALPPLAATDSCDGSASSSVLHAGAALPQPCFSSDSAPANGSCFDFPWSPDALLSVDDLG